MAQSVLPAVSKAKEGSGLPKPSTRLGDGMCKHFDPERAPPGRAPIGKVLRRPASRFWTGICRAGRQFLSDTCTTCETPSPRSMLSAHVPWLNVGGEAARFR